MKIFATADIHGNKIIVDKLNDIKDEADLILICGDIGGKGISGKTFKQFSEYQKEDAIYLCNVLDNFKIDSRFILGNDDWFESEHNKYLKSSERMVFNLYPLSLYLLHLSIPIGRSTKTN